MEFVVEFRCHLRQVVALLQVFQIQLTIKYEFRNHVKLGCSGVNVYPNNSKQFPKRK